MQQAVSISAPIAPSALALRRGTLERWFFVGLASVVVATVAVGFAPSLYLRGLGTEGLPPTLHAYLHGVALTGWFLLFFAQTLLVASGRTQVHRRLGVAGVVFGLAVIVTTVVMVEHALDEPLRRLPLGTAAAAT